MRGLALIACFASAACYSPSVHEGAPCGVGDVCPTGLVCDHGTCLFHARPDDAGLVDTADAVPDAAPDAYVPCSGSALFTDLLDNTGAGPIFEETEANGLTVTEGSGHVDVVFAGTVTAPAYGFYSSRISYTTDGLCVRLEVSDLAEANALTFLKVSFGTTEVEFLASGGTLALRSKTSTATTSHKSFAASVVTHRYWRLRFESNTTFWDTSPDDVTYTEQTSVNGVFPETSGYILFGAGAATDVTSGDKARFESIQATGR